VNQSGRGEARVSVFEVGGHRLRALFHVLDLRVAHRDGKIVVPMMMHQAGFTGCYFDCEGAHEQVLKRQVMVRFGGDLHRRLGLLGQQGNRQQE